MPSNVVPLARSAGKGRPKPRDTRLGEMLPTIQAALNRLASQWKDNTRSCTLGPFEIFENRIALPDSRSFPVTIIDIRYSGLVSAKVMSLHLLLANNGDDLGGKVRIVSWQRGTWEDDLLARCRRALGQRPAGSVTRRFPRRPHRP